MYRKHSTFSFIALVLCHYSLNINHLASAIQQLRDCYQATRTVKGRHRPGQLKMATAIKTATNVDYIDDIYRDDIRSRWLPTLPDE